MTLVNSGLKGLNDIQQSRRGCGDLICADICNLGQYMIQIKKFGNGGTFCPSLPYSNNFDKGIPSRFFAEDVYLCFGIYFKLFMENSTQTTCCLPIIPTFVSL